MASCDPVRGECVECLATEDAACAGRTCTRENVCSEYDNDRITCQACDTDANCVDADHLCVPMDWMGMPQGGYCLRKYLTGCTRPFSASITGRTSLSGVASFTYCGIDETLSTCDAFRALMEALPCPGGAGCPTGGLCRTVGGVSGQCTYQCGSALGCPLAGLVATCGNGGAGVTYCGG
jgi:hypothetical protein